MEKKAKMTNYKQREEKDKEDKYLLGQMGKLPPQAVEVEEVVLGALMLEREAINTVCMLLTPEMFYKDEHAEVYRAVIGLFKDGEPIDIISVTNALRKAGKLDEVGGPFFIAELTNRVASSANIEFHSRIVKEKWVLRSLIVISQETIAQAYDDTVDVFDVESNLQAKLLKLTNTLIGSDFKTPSETSMSAIEQVNAAFNGDGKFAGLSTCIKEVDRKIGGLKESNLTILAGRPGSGKTSFALQVAYSLGVIQRKPVAFISLEMSADELMKKLFAIDTGIDSDRITKGRLSENELRLVNVSANTFANSLIYIDDGVNSNIIQLRAKMLRMKLLYNVELVIVDYLQLMDGVGTKIGNRNQEIGDISRGLKRLAKELKVPIIALSQLSRAVEQRGGAKRPILSDLRDSGNIEQDADQVIFMYRAEYYGFTETEDGQSTEGLAEIILAKNRHGSIGSARLNFHAPTSRFTDLQFQSIGAQKPTEQGDEPF